MKKKNDSDDLSGFQDFELAHGRRDPKTFDAKEVNSLALSKRGRLTIPGFIKAKYKYHGDYFIVRHRAEKELLVQFVSEKSEAVKTVSYYADKTSTMYVEVGPQIKALKRVINKSTSLKFRDIKGKNAFILDISSLPLL